MPSMLIVDGGLRPRKLVLTYAQMENYQCPKVENERMVFTREHLGPYRKLIETIMGVGYKFEYKE